MPRAKYAYDKKKKLYYINFKTGARLANGKPEYKKITATTVAKLDEKVKVANKNAAHMIAPGKLTVDKWFEEWFDTYKSNCRESTKVFYRNKYTWYIKGAIGPLNVVDVTEAKCQKILTELSKTHARKTVKEVGTIMKAMFDKARINRIIVVNPAQDLQIKGIPAIKRRELSATERARYLETCKTHYFGMFAAFLYFFGLRRGEALALRKDNIDIASNVIRIKTQITHPTNKEPVESAPKTQAGVRSIPIPLKSREYIDFEHLPEGFLFTGPTGEPLTFAMTRKRWSDFITTAFPQGTDISMHTLRHNYCTMLFEQGLTPFEAKNYLGHSDAKTTSDIYAHFSEKMKRTSDVKILDIG